MPEEDEGWQLFMLDDGCQLWDSCLNCPLPLCKDDVGDEAARAAARRAGVGFQYRGKQYALGRHVAVG